MTSIAVDGHTLTLEAVAAVARHGASVHLAPEARLRMQESRGWVEALVERGAPVYGINTGFGIFADRQISTEDTARLQRNLILSHAAGVGEPFEPEVVRAAMLIRANALALGHSGVRPELAETLLNMLNAGVTPIVPSQGSLGSSGDLAPLSHLALVMSRGDHDQELNSGYVWYQGQALSGKAGMAAAGLPRLVLGAKESLALNNGTAFSTALAALAVRDGYRCLEAAQVALALSLEALRGASAAFDPRLHAARGHPGQVRVAANLRRLLAGSTLIDSAGRVQDAYSLRCAPQVLGPAYDALDFVTSVLTRELNAATDNPLLLEGEAVSGGNFHGEPVGQAADFAAIALAEVAAISERRVARLIDGKLNDGLPPMLVGTPEAAGLHSGLMMPQYTAAALVLENQTLASPDSVRSLPTSANQEDFNANSATAARHLRRLVENVTRVIAIELLTAAQALELRLRLTPGARLGDGTARGLAWVRATAPFVEQDQLYGRYVEALAERVRQEPAPGLG